MNINPDSKETLALNLFTGGNSPPALANALARNERHPNGCNGSPLAASKMEPSPTVLLSYDYGTITKTRKM
jgi:hypothetical protein